MTLAIQSLPIKDARLNSHRAGLEVLPKLSAPA